MVRKREKERIILRCQADRPTHTHTESENLKHLERSQKMTGRVMKRKTAAEDGEDYKKKTKKHFFLLPRLYFHKMCRLVVLVYY